MGGGGRGMIRAEERLEAVSRGAFKSAYFLVRKMRLKSLGALTGRI